MGVGEAGCKQTGVNISMPTDHLTSPNSWTSASACQESKARFDLVSNTCPCAPCSMRAHVCPTLPPQQPPFLGTEPAASPHTPWSWCKSFYHLPAPATALHHLDAPGLLPTCSLSPGRVDPSALGHLCSFLSSLTHLAIFMSPLLPLLNH